MGQRAKKKLEHFNIEHILSKIKGLSPQENSIVRQGLDLLKAVDEELIDSAIVHANDLKELGPIVGLRLRNLRGNKKMTQEKLEERSGVSQATISKIESGSRMVTPGEAKKLAKALGATPQFIIAGKKG